ncbi:class I SAM-dependent methyltransferase [Halotia wernerae UHCC 0503]|nr:class I SAM-dependent methyltransferase [Halotia wernerae UHCC 0503]
MTDQKESTTKLVGVTETLMITFHGRYMEQARYDCILKDEKAVEMQDKIDYDFSKYIHGWASQLGTVLRAKAIDDAVKKFIANHPNTTIINLGAGLCTRFFRINNGELHWYEVDFPEVIELKQKLIHENHRYKLISCSILESTWISQIETKANQPLFIIMEGVSMYLTEAENKLLFQQIQKHLAPVEMIFDVASCEFAKNTNRHDTVSKTSASFKWGTDNSSELESWGLGIKLKDEVYYRSCFANYPQRLKPWWIRYFRFMLVPLLKNSVRILQIQIALS